MITKMDIQFPVLGMKVKDARLYGIAEKDYGFVSKGQGKFYNGLKIIDSKGDMFSVKSWSVKGRSGFLNSILYLQRLEILDIEYEFTGCTTLEELKQMIVAHIHKHPKTFLPMYDGALWTKRLELLNTFEEIIITFR